MTILFFIYLAVALWTYICGLFIDVSDLIEHYSLLQINIGLVIAALGWPLFFPAVIYLRYKGESNG